MEKTKIAAAIAAAGLSVWSVQAQAAFYIGAGIGNATIESDGDIDGADFDFDESDTGYKLFGGYMFNDIIGVEVGYLDFGSPEGDFGFDSGEGIINADLEGELTGWTVEGIAQLPLGPVNVFAKAGFFSYDAELEASVPGFGSGSVETDGEGYTFGAGAGIQLGPIGVRAEVENFDVDDLDDVYMFSISALLKI